MTEPIAQNRSQVLAAKRWMDDEQGMERASLSPAEYVAYRMRISPADALNRTGFLGGPIP